MSTLNIEKVKNLTQNIDKCDYFHDFDTKKSSFLNETSSIWYIKVIRKCDQKKDHTQTSMVFEINLVLEIYSIIKCILYLVKYFVIFHFKMSYSILKCHFTYELYDLKDVILFL